MKLFCSISKKNFSIKRFIKPRHTQQYFDNEVVNKHQDKVNHKLIHLISYLNSINYLIDKL